MSTGAADAASRRAERRLVEQLRQAGATSPEAACPLAGSSWMEAGTLRRLQASGVIREAEPGRLYLDEAAYASYRGRRRVRALAIVGGLAAVVGLAAWLASRG